MASKKVTPKVKSFEVKNGQIVRPKPKQEKKVKEVVKVNEGLNKAPEFTVVKNRHNQFVLHYGKRFIGRFATEEDANSVAEGIASKVQNG